MKCARCDLDPSAWGLVLYRTTPMGTAGPFVCWWCLTKEEAARHNPPLPHYIARPRCLGGHGWSPSAMKKQAKRNPGHAFESQVADICELYERQGLARMKQVSPPTKTLHKPGGGSFTINLPSPYLDFLGTWMERAGKTIMVECKATDEPTLRVLGRDEKGKDQAGAGIKASQLDNAFAWERAGAAVAFLWYHNDQVRLLTPKMVVATLASSGRKSLQWHEAHKVPQGEGFVLYDFLACLRALHR